MIPLLAPRIGRWIVPLAMLYGLFASPAPLPGQNPLIGSRSAPHDGYRNSFQSFFDGDFRAAGKDFREAAKDGIVNADLNVGGPWIDAICYRTMLGECAYQMGDLPGALEQYTTALNLAIQNRNWMLRIEFPPGINPEQNLKTAPTWGGSTRRTRLGQFPERFPSLRGRVDNSQVLKTGGIVQPPSFMPVYVSEIVRCTALAMSRRRELLGPTCEFDPLTARLVDAFSSRPGPPNHWSQCWIELQLGLAYAAANKLPQAINELNKSLLAMDQFDHPLTCVALLELGRIAFDEGKYDVAVNYFHEATISAAYFDLYVVMEEAFRRGAEAHLLSGQPGVYAPLAPALAATSKVRTLQVSLLVALAEQFLAKGDAGGAAHALAQARGALGRREMAQGTIGSRLNYQAARLALQSGDAKSGAGSLALALNYQKSASHRLLQISLADGLFRNNGISERIADILYGQVLREPTPQDWLVDPLDTMATLAAAHPLPYEHWLELTLARRDQDKALNITDRIRRHRFHATQPLGGRLLALRWVLEAPPELLSETALAQRQDLLLKYPAYAELSRRAKEVREQLSQLPFAPLADAQARPHQELLAELGKISTAQEGLLQRLALERIPCELAFPPLRDTKEIQQRLPPGTLLFSYLATSRQLYGFALSRDRYSYFTLPQPAKIKSDVTELLRQMGHTDRSQPVSAGDLLDGGWQTPAERLVKQLFSDWKPEAWEAGREVVIVPDGVLWYLPFEALPISMGGGTKPLLRHLPLRYAPTLALAVPEQRGPRPNSRTAIVAGKLHPREDDAFTKATLESLSAASGDVTVLRRELPASSALLTVAADRLIVLADGDDVERSPWGWSPLVVDSGKPGGTLADWLQLPLGGAEQVILPAFHTAAETGLKRGGSGDEMFLAVCGLMGSGCRTALLSRWRVGGQSTADLMREFVQELPHESAPAAWRRSVQVAAARPLEPAAETRVRMTPAGNALTADHPFFWSGYLLVDRGQFPAD
jgi:CHAT domain